MNKKVYVKGFTIVELLVVIIVIGILAVISIISYGNIQAKARDSSVLSDVEIMDTSQTNYTLNGGSVGKVYSSSSGYDSDLDFKPTTDNVIDVVVDYLGYCIRGYNPNGTKNSIYNAYTKESYDGACNANMPSQALMDAYTGPKVWIQVSVGAYHACGITSEQKAYCWGYNEFGQLGNGNTGTNSFSPVAVSTSGVLGGKKLRSISTHYAHNCVIDSSGVIYCWGWNNAGQLGIGTSGAGNDSNVPVLVNMTGSLSGKTIKTVTMNWQRTCVLASDNQVYCWGGDDYGSLGDNVSTSGNPKSVPTPLYTAGALSGKTILSLSAEGDYHNCVLASDKKAYCWGYNNYGQVGDGTRTTQPVPVAVDTTGVLANKTIKLLTAFDKHTCAVASDDKIYCWGRNDYRQLGDNTADADRIMPGAVYNGGILNGKAISYMANSGSPNHHTCIMDSNGLSYCWGRNDYGQLGDGTVNTVALPTFLNGNGMIDNKKLIMIKGSTYNTCAINTDYKLYCWGQNNYGQIGQGSSSGTPTKIPTLVNVP